jgi:CubicO group peptidase (beta-lactamase class C family)/peptidoglycan/LPS O-acetylase OafA/YrhL
MRVDSQAVVDVDIEEPFEYFERQFVAATESSAHVPTSKAPTSKARDGFLDTIRAIATIRVVIWHAFGAPFLSFFVASMPTMFFVAGSLLASSLGRRDTRSVIRDRGRRLLLPFWMFGAFSLTVMAVSRVVGGGAQTRLSPGHLLSWILPVIDPKGTAWEGGWLAQPLWYLRAFLWLLAAAPVLQRGLKRFGNIVFVPPIAVIFMVEACIRVPRLAPPGFSVWRWYVGDFALYSIFIMLGFRHREGAFAKLSMSARVEWLAIFASLAVAWCTSQPLIGNVVNNSYPAHFLVGTAWLFAFLVLEPVLRKGTSARYVGPLVRWMTQRSLTVYLWHTTAIVCAHTLLNKFAPGAPSIVVLPIIVVLIPMFTMAVGWIEDVAAGRSARLWPTSIPALDDVMLAVAEQGRRLPASLRKHGKSWPVGIAGFASAMALVSVLPSSSSKSASGSTNTEASSTAEVSRGDIANDAKSNGRRPPAPSARPQTAVFEKTATATKVGESAPVTGVTGRTVSAPASGEAVSPEVALKLQGAVDAWRASNAVEGVTLAVSTADGRLWSSGSGSLGAGEEIDSTSVTKTFTAALILKLVEAGKIDLDKPVPALTKAPSFPTSAGITPRQLLNHSSGLATYQDSPEYKANPSMKVTPVIAVELASKQKLLWVPGTNSGYSSSGYLTLGLLAEQVGGADFKSQLDRELFGPVGLQSTRLDEQQLDGWIGWATGGIKSTAPDLVKWGTALYREKSVLTPGSSAAMVDVSNEWSVGLGAWPVCPCSLDASGKKIYTAIGHHGGSGLLEYSPSDGLVIAAFLSEPIFDGRITQQDVHDLLDKLRIAAK